MFVVLFIVKLLVLGDLHGSIPNIYFNDFDAIITPGDFCSDEARNVMFKALKQKNNIEWYSVIGKREARRVINKSLSDGRRVLEFLNSFNVPVFIVPGNWDFTGSKNVKWDFLRKNHFTSLIKGLSNIVNVNYKLIDFNDYQIIGYGISSGPEYPQYDVNSISKEELRKDKIDFNNKLKRMKSLFNKASKPVIFLSHNVPFNTPLDVIVNKNSPRNGYHYGSLVVRKIIEEFKPLISIGGHMHEHFGKCLINKAIAINAGFGPNVNILIELQNNKIKKLKFVKK